MTRAAQHNAEWRLTDTNRRAKFYRLTALGRRQLQVEYGAWRSYVAIPQKHADCLRRERPVLAAGRASAQRLAALLEGVLGRLG